MALVNSFSSETTITKMTSSISSYWPGCLAPSFSASTICSGSTFTTSLDTFKGKLVLLIFYPVDFGYICPTELVAVQDQLLEFQKEDCEVLAISTGSVLGKVAFVSSAREEGGVEKIKIGLVEDKEGEISRIYGVMKEGSGYSYRAMVLIDKKGVVICRMLSDLPIGCGINETLRLLKARDTNEDNIGQNELTAQPEEAFGDAAISI